MAYQTEIEKLEQRFREKPEQWFAALADAYRKAGEVERALDVVRGGLEKRPNYTSGHIVLGRCLLDQLNDEEAVLAFERVLQLDAENIIALKSLSEIAERRGDVLEARRWLERLLDVDPMNDEARAALSALEASGIAAGEAAGPVLGETVAILESPAAEPVEQATAATARVPALDETVLERLEEQAEPAPPHGPPQPEPEEEPEVVLGAAVEDDREVPEFPGELVVERAAASGDEEEGPTVEMEPIGLERVPEAEFQPPTEPTPEEEELAGAETLHISGSAEPLDVTAFDEELAWGAGERLSREISQEDLARAEALHEESLEEPVHYLPGLEDVEVPRLGAEPMGEPPEPAAAGEPPEERSGAEGERAAPAAGIPLIFPDDEPRAPLAEEEREPEPVVTETMAEVYARQGLFNEARQIYEGLLARRPGDPDLLRRLAQLDEVLTPARPAGRARREERFAAAATGGQPVREMLLAIATARPGVVQAPVPEAALAERAEPGVIPEPEPFAEPGPFPAEGPREPVGGAEPPGESAMAEAFDADLEEPPGAPAAPAADDVSLASVFGEEPAPPPAPPPPSRSGTPPKPREASYEEFFGGEGSAPGSGPAAAPSEGDDGDQDFRNWLEGLKT
jgi:tetratricopeptide (TPR) repeat protein